MCAVGYGKKTVYDKTIGCWQRSGHGTETLEDVLANWEYIWDEAIVYNVLSTIVYTNEPKKDFDWYDGLKLLHLIDFAA